MWAVAAAVGISALLTASETAYTVIKLGGAAYMVWLGFGMLRSAWQSTTGQSSTGQATGAHYNAEAHATAATQPELLNTASFGDSFRRGLLTNLLNPKVGAFYVALLPQFMPPESPKLLSGLLLGLVHSTEGLLWLSLLAFGAHRARQWLARPGTVRAVDGVAGVAVVGFGLKLGLTH